MSLEHSFRTVTVWMLLALPAVSAALAEGSEPVLTLERAIAIAEASNRRLHAADAALEAAGAGVDEARGLRLPRVDLTGEVQRTDNPVLVFGNRLRQGSFMAEDFDLDRLNHPDPLSNWNLRLSLEQPLWTGGRIAHSERAAEQRREAAVAGRERSRQELVRQVTESYTAAIVAGHQLAVAREALATAEAHVRLTDDLHQAGLVVESDLLSARVRESEVREVVIRAESGIEVARAVLNLALGVDLDTAFVLPQDLAERGEVEGDLAALVERARQRRPDLEVARQGEALAASAVALAKSARKPQVGLGAAYETNAEDFFGTGGENWTVSAGFRLPLFDGSRARARVRGARAVAEEAQQRQELLARSIGLEVRRAFHELRAARQRLEQAAVGAELAQRSLGIVTDRYKEGLVTLPELLGAETALTEARLRRVAARRDAILARAGLDLATGDL